MGFGCQNDSGITSRKGSADESAHDIDEEGIVGIQLNDMSYLVVIRRVRRRRDCLNASIRYCATTHYLEVIPPGQDAIEAFKIMRLRERQVYTEKTVIRAGWTDITPPFPSWDCQKIYTAREI
jgi:hypothetical protein